MHPFWYKVLFRRAGKPRGWTGVVLFRRDRTARTLFYPVVHKKSGAVRAHWAYWISDAPTRGAAPRAPEHERSPSEKFLAKQLEPAEQALSQLRRFDQTVASWRQNALVPELLPVEAIVDRLLLASSAGIVLSAGHDNYRAIPGGVHLCIQREEKIAISRGWAYLQFHPWEPLPCLAPDTDGRNLPVTMLLNGTQIGTATMSSLTAAVGRCVGAGRTVRLAVHHLLGHSPEAMARLAHAAKVREVPFWLHDFFALCPSYTLRRNGLTFCGAPAATSNACGLCVFGPARPLHQERIAAFFQSVPIVAVAPSQITADFWSSKSDLPVQGLAVIPHVVPAERPRATPERIETGAPITVGFLGAAVDHEGWPVDDELMSREIEPGTRLVAHSAKRPDLACLLPNDANQVSLSSSSTHKVLAARCNSDKGRIN